MDWKDVNIDMRDGVDCGESCSYTYGDENIYNRNNDDDCEATSCNHSSERRTRVEKRERYTRTSYDDSSSDKKRGFRVTDKRSSAMNTTDDSDDTPAWLSFFGKGLYVTFVCGAGAILGTPLGYCFGQLVGEIQGQHPLSKIKTNYNIPAGDADIKGYNKDLMLDISELPVKDNKSVMHVMQSRLEKFVSMLPQQKAEWSDKDKKIYSYAVRTMRCFAINAGLEYKEPNNEVNNGFVVHNKDKAFSYATVRQNQLSR